MTCDVKSRGRPKGTGLNDSQTLKSMADLMAKDPRLCMAAAAREVLGRINEATTRRLQRKWREMGGGLLAAAKAERQAELRRDAEQALVAAQKIMEDISFAQNAEINQLLRGEGIRLDAVRSQMPGSLAHLFGGTRGSVEANRLSLGDALAERASRFGEFVDRSTLGSWAGAGLTQDLAREMETTLRNLCMQAVRPSLADQFDIRRALGLAGVDHGRARKSFA